MLNGLILSGIEKNDVFGASAVQRSAGAHRIASFLRNHDYAVEVLDFFIYWTEEQLKEFIRSRYSSKLKFLGVSTTFINSNSQLVNILNWFKKEYPSVKIICGGPISGEFNLPADYFIQGFAEVAILEVLKSLDKGSGLKYTLWKNNSKLVRANLDYPAFPLENLEIKYQKNDFIDSNETLTTELARGCKFNCDFCYFPILGVKGDYSRSAKNFENELRENYEKWGVKSYRLADETINDRTEKLDKFANVVQSLPFSVYLSGFIRADLLISRKDDIELVNAMNLLGHHYGIETLHWESGKKIGKGMNPDRLKEGLISIDKFFRERQRAYFSTISLIEGFENDTTLFDTYEWFKKHLVETSIRLFPLYIPSINSEDNKSEYSKSIGSVYKEMSTLDLKPYVDCLEFNYLKNEWTNKGVFWKTSSHNIFDSVKRIKTFYKSYLRHARPLIWALGDYKLAYSVDEADLLGKTILELDYKKSQISLTSFANNYIAKKLSSTCE